MSIIQAFSGAISGTFADQWKEIVTAGNFDEHTAVAPGVLRESNRGRGSNYSGSDGVISSGSKIYVPENTAAFIFSQGGIEEIITSPGGYEYLGGQATVFSKDGFSGASIKSAFVDQVANRIGFGGQSSDDKRVAFINLREIRGIKFGTKGPIIYHDKFYETDLEVTSYGSFSLKISEPEKFVKSFLPANVSNYTFAAAEVRQQMIAEFLQAYLVSLNSLSAEYRVSQIPAQANAIVELIRNSGSGVGTWSARFGIEITGIGIESIEFTDDSRELVRNYSSNRMNIKAYEGVSEAAASISAQQKIAQGVENHGLGEGGGMLLGMNVAQGLGVAVSAPPAAPSPLPVEAPHSSLTLDEQIEAVKKIKELVDAGFLTEEEFTAKKKEIMGF